MSTNEWRRANTPEELAARFGIDNPPMAPMANTQVRAIVRAEDIMRKVWGDFGLADEMLFDPARVPAMARLAEAAASEFHWRESQGGCDRAEGLRPSLNYDTADTDFDADCPSEQGVVKVWRVGTNHVQVVRERWHDAPTRRLTTAGWAATALRSSVDLYDWMDCSKFGCKGDCGMECNVRLSEDCGGTTRLLPVHRGTLVMLFRVCWACAHEAEAACGLPDTRRGA
ncbi:hypothetical protein [Mycolicibacterium porcinum]|uniref:Uncharacterized protein n=1 Tax=Mycolicibacterium porcinum TaxID=39693 RepID=A0ABV3VFM7_9MYCO